ncbi:hypothetical protein ACHAXT_007956, partial [Thalassiosira profunda]
IQIVAALLSPLFMSIGFFLWDCRWTSSGASAFALNMFKCNVASLGFVLMCLLRGFALSSEDPSSVFTQSTVGFLVLSSTLGILVGDILWLEALRLLGAKHVIVIDSLKPFAAAILGRVALDEVLRGAAWGGMALTVVGVGVVSWEEQRTPGTNAAAKEEKEEREEAKEDGKDVSQTEATERIAFETDAEGSDMIRDSTALSEVGDADVVEVRENASESTSAQAAPYAATNRKRFRRGYVCAIVNVLADSFGSLLTKKYGEGMTTWAINLIRFGFAGVVLLCISVGMRFRRRYALSNVPEGRKPDTSTPAATAATPVSASLKSTPPRWYELPALTRMGWLQILAGVAFVTFLCPALSNYALFQIALGLAVSLGSIGPLYGLFLDWPFKGKRPNDVWGLFGVLLAIAGVVILCIWGTA